MTTLQKLAWVYAIGFFLVVAVGYVPGFKDEQGLLFGGFKIDLIDDVLHFGSGAWAAIAAWRSAKASEYYFKLFGSFYTLDACIGFFTGYAILDLVIGNWTANAGYMLTDVATNLAVNLPHFILGPLAMYIGFVVSKNSDVKKHAPKKTK